MNAPKPPQIVKFPHSKFRILGIFPNAPKTKKGTIEESGGIKLGDGCFTIPIENLRTIIDFLKQHNVKFKILNAYMPAGRQNIT